MNTLIINKLNAVIRYLMVVTVLLTVTVTFGAEPNENAKSNNVEHSHKDVTAGSILLSGYETPFLTEGRMPLPREDLVPISTAVTGVGGTQTAPVDEIQLKISSRASDSQMLSFASRTTMQQLSSIYLEASQMIDSRHVSPTPYNERMRAAVQGLINATQNQTWLRANGSNGNPQMISNTQNQLWQLAQTSNAQRASDAVGIMQAAAEIVSRNMGVRREAAALEFMNGTLDSLDQYSSFIPNGTTGSTGSIDLVQTVSLSEKVVGIGVELKTHPRGVEVVDVIENGPAHELGILPGDVIVGVDMQEMNGRTLNDVADRIGGRVGTNVTIDVVRNGQRLRGTLVRRQVHVSSVSGAKILDPQTGTAYVRLKQFSASSHTDLEKAMWNLHNQGMKNLILDLRGNPGGLLDVSIHVSNLFVPHGTIVSTKGRNASDNSVEVAKFEKTWSTPLVVLVDENSASASEIFAAAIQDNRRGVIVGRKSYGKGTVQTHFPMQTVSATLKLTTAKFYAPSGREMAGQGVTPDVPVNVPTNASVRGTTNDADIQMALQVTRQGHPANLAAQVGQNRNNVGQIHNTDSTTNPVIGQPNLSNFRQF